MNKYLKILALSSGILGAVAPTAIKIDDNNINSDLHNMYENVEKMQNIVPKLSKINYMLNIDPIQDENVKFITTDDSGEQTELSNEETISYLNETLQQTNIEYEQLKQTLTNAIKETMDYLDRYRNSETELTNEQKIYIKEHSNSIKFLADTLEDLSEEIICTIDGCENCDDSEEFNKATSIYISAINDLEERIQALQNTLSSLQFINGIGNPHFYASHIYTPNHIVYGLHYGLPEDEQNDLNIDSNIQDGDDITNNEDNTIEHKNPEQNNTDISNVEDITNKLNNEDTSTTEQNDKILDNNAVDVEQTNSDSDIDKDNNENSKPTTFGLKSNIDTYAPTKRNIDTFFNTALYNNDYAYGGGNYTPYGYGGGYGYGMPYNNYYGHPYGMSGFNSNMINREIMRNQNSGVNDNNMNAVANIEDDVKDEIQKPKKIHARKAKNVDTYKGVTVQSNVNTMGESKISRFFKEKFNNLRNKVRKQKEERIENKQDLQDNLKDKIYDERVTQETKIEDTNAVADITKNVSMQTENDMDNNQSDNIDENNKLDNQLSVFDDENSNLQLETSYNTINEDRQIQAK